MIGRVHYREIDRVAFVVANLVNLLMVAIFLTRARGSPRVEAVLGLVLVGLIFPMGVVLVVNVVGQRPWWCIVFPALLILFFVLELVLDYILKMDFRTTVLLWPYLMLYYAALIGMIGYSFAIGRVCGLVTLGTYFLNLAATWYAHSR